MTEGGHAATSARMLLALLAARRGGRVDAPDGAPSVVHPVELRAPTALRCAEWLAESRLLHQQPDAAATTVWTTLNQLQTHWLGSFVGRLLSLGVRAHADEVAVGLDRRDADVVADARGAAEALRERAVRLHPDPLDESAVPSPTAAADAATWEAEQTRLYGAGDPDGWGAAAGQWHAASRPYEAAWARWRQAEALLARHPRRRDAVLAIREARDIAQQLGARPLQHRLDVLARHAHLDAFVAERAESAAPRAGRSPSLTPREIDVLRLVADGLPNREIARSLVLSHKTVETHLTHVLVKLDVHDRVSAVTRAQRLGLIG